jgi:hypothetical protein
MTLTLPVAQPAAYVHADNRALVLSNGQRTLLFNRAQGRWIGEALAIIEEERRATRIQQHHVFGGFVEEAGTVVLFAGLQDDLVSVQLSAEAFRALRSEFATG